MTVPLVVLAVLALFGGLVTGPVNFLWLNTLERWTTRLAPAGGTRAGRPAPARGRPPGGTAGTRSR